MKPSAPVISIPNAAVKAEPPSVFHRGSGRTLLWAAEESPLFDSGYGYYENCTHF